MNGLINVISQIIAGFLLLVGLAALGLIAYASFASADRDASEPEQGIIIDIQPDGGGLEGELGREELGQVIGTATSAAYGREGKQGQHAK